MVNLWLRITSIILPQERKTWRSLACELWQRHLASSPIAIPSACKGTSHPWSRMKKLKESQKIGAEHPAQMWTPSIQAQIVGICVPKKQNGV